MQPAIIGNQQQAVDLALSPWTQFGFPGIVVGALFGVLIFFIRQHYVERDKREEAAKAERAEWRSDIKGIATGHDAAVKEMTDRFIQLHEKTLDAVRTNKRD